MKNGAKHYLKKMLGGIKMRKIIFVFLLIITMLLVACSGNMDDNGAGIIDTTNPTTQSQNGDQVDIAVSSPMTVSENLIRYNDADAYLRLKMVKGKYYEDWSPKTISGTVLEGSFIFELSDGFGNTITQTELSSFYSKPLIFTDKFNIELDDYNNDGKLDFTLGQYSLNNGKSYKIFTIESDGTIEELVIKDTPELFISSGLDSFSTKLTKSDNKSFKVRQYNSDTGKTFESIYQWKTDRFVNVETREIRALEGYHEIMSNDLLLPKEMLEYIRGNIGHSLESDAADLVLRLETLQKNYIDQLTEKYYSDEVARDELIKLGTIPSTAENIQNAALRELLNDSYSNGFKTETAEGDYFPVIDYQIYRQFSEYLPNDLQEYFQLMAVESDKIPARDGSLVIDWEEVVRRSYSQQEFILNNEKSQKLADVQELFEKYVSFIFNGLPNTPDFSYETKRLDSKLREALMHIAEEKGDTPLEKKIAEYLDVLEKNGYKLNDEVKQFRSMAIADLSGLGN